MDSYVHKIYHTGFGRIDDEGFVVADSAWGCAVRGRGNGKGDGFGYGTGVSRYALSGIDITLVASAVPGRSNGQGKSTMYAWWGLPFVPVEIVITVVHN
jgi:hypothetical protein